MSLRHNLQTVFFTPRPLTFGRALPTVSFVMPIAVYRGIGVSFIIRVALWAVGLFRFPPAPSPYVDQAGHWLQMLRVAAMTHSTEMVKRQAMRDWPNQERIGNAMCEPEVISYRCKSPISIGRLTFGPQPTRPKIGSVLGDRALPVNVLPKAPNRVSASAYSMVIVAKSTCSLLWRLATTTLTKAERNGRMRLHRKVAPFGVTPPGVSTPRGHLLSPSIAQGGAL